MTIVVVVALGVVLYSRALEYWVAVDDAFIAFRYAENLARGHGLVFNVAERVEGYTSVLWVLILACAHALGADTLASAQHLGALAGALVVPAIWWCARRGMNLGPAASMLPCAVVTASASFAVWMGSGMETPLYALMFTLALGRALIDLRRGALTPITGLLFGAVALVRPEAIGLFAVLCAAAVALRCVPTRALIPACVGLALLIVPHLAFRWLYYGYPLPNTFYAKTSLAEPMWADGLSYVGTFLLQHGPWSLLAIFGLALEGPRRDRALCLVPFAVIAAALVYVAWTGGDFYFYSRYCVPYLPWLALLLCAGAVRLAERARARWAKRRVAAAYVMVVLPVVVAASAALPAALWPEAQYRVEYERTLRGTADGMAAFGRWLREHHRPDTVMASCGAGRIPYYSGFVNIDMLGLVDEHIAHREIEFQPGLAGHQRYDSEYVLSREPDIFVPVLGTSDARFSPSADLDTGEIHRFMLRFKWWPAPTDLTGRRDFRRAYGPTAATVADGMFFVYFVREREMLGTAVDLSVADADRWISSAWEHRRRGLPGDAAMILEALRREGHESFEASFALAFMRHEQRRPEEALELFEELARTHRDQPEVDYGLALALWGLGRRDEAAGRFRRYLSRAPRGRWAVDARLRLRR